ncbi:hypothetical protein [Jiangella alkaliphila]|uniref:hypothetical protein n=1 Tax=Jiangella alkaliphila TaxID=419479 RepID=UPI00128BE70F|nr:hypothetical protein [Jiangella alkaliphila]
MPSTAAPARFATALDLAVVALVAVAPRPCRVAVPGLRPPVRSNERDVALRRRRCRQQVPAEEGQRGGLVLPRPCGLLTSTFMVAFGT